MIVNLAMSHDNAQVIRSYPLLCPHIDVTWCVSLA